jgi:hypothetical protein
MTKITRRTFVKRSGAATLGSALGLGVLPSLTRRLHAEDTSLESSQGVAILFKTANDVSVFSVNGGLLTVSQVLTVSTASGLCVPSLKTTRAYDFNYSKTVDGVVYTGKAAGVVHRYYKCIDGVPTVTYAYGTNLGPVGISNGKTAIGAMDPAIRDSDGGQTSTGEARLVFEDGEWSDWYPGANIPYKVICCTLPL